MFLFVVITLLWILVIGLMISPFYILLKDDVINFKENVDWRWLLIACVILNLFTIFFISSEETIYIWDFKTFWELSIVFSKSFYINPFKAFWMLYKSIINSDYNFLSAVFLAPFVKVFGVSRMAYELLLINLFIVPTAIGSTLFYHSTIDKLTKPTVTLSIIILLFFPLALIPTLKGYIDIIGMPFFFLILFLIQKIKKQDFNLTYAVIIFQLIITTIFLRRWYGIWIQSIIIFTIIYYLIDIYKNKNLLKYIKYLGILLLLSSFTFLLFKNFFIRSMSTDYRDIYSAYSSGSIINNCFALFNKIGLIYLFISLIGFFFLLRNKKAVVFSVGIFLSLIIIIISFSKIQDFGIHHRIILFPAIYIFLISAINSVYKINNKIAISILISIFVFLFVFVYNKSEVKNIFFPNTSFKPMVNPYMKTIKAINVSINELTKGQTACVMTLVSSEYFNDETIRFANFPIELNPNPVFLITHHVDKRDGLPLELFTTARFVLVTENTQTHLAESDQWVISKFNQWIFAGPFTHKYILVKEFYDANIGNIRILKREQPYNTSDLDFVESEFKKKYANYPNLTEINRNILQIKGSEGDIK